MYTLGAILDENFRNPSCTFTWVGALEQTHLTPLRAKVKLRIRGT
jgi:hypothetical protein